MKRCNFQYYDIKRYTSLRQLVNERAENLPDKTFFGYMVDKRKRKVEISSAEFKRQTEALGTWLSANGYSGMSIAVLGENSYEWLLSFFALTGGNNTAVTLDKELSPDKLAELLTDSGSKALICSETYSDIGEALSKKLGITVISMADIPDHIKEGEKLIAEGDLSYVNYTGYENSEVIVFSSGTTGRNKGVRLTSRSIALDVASAARNNDYSGDTLLLLPLHHSYGLVAGILITLMWGGSVYINSSLRYLNDDLKLFTPRVLYLVPLFVETFYKSIWKAAAASGKTEAMKSEISVCNEKDLSLAERRKIFSDVMDFFGGKIELLICGGAPLRQEYIDRFRDFGLKVMNGYGITECSPIVSVNSDRMEKDGSVGYVLDECDVFIDCPDSSGEGEICVSGPVVMQGYHNMEAETKRSLINGVFHTGDLGRLDDDGFLYVTGRIKNLIILSNGKNVAPEELEDNILSVGFVKEVVVSENDGVLCAEIFPEETDEISAEEEKGKIRAGIEAINIDQPVYKRIEKIIFRDTEFPKTTSKKIIRNYK